MRRSAFGTRMQEDGGVDLLANDAVEFPAPTPLRTPAGPRAGEVCLMLRAPFRHERDSVAIRTPYGRIVRPWALAIRDDGGGDTLRAITLQGLDEVCLGPAAGTALRPPYRAVRVMTPDALTLDRVGWQSVAREAASPATPGARS